MSGRVGPHQLRHKKKNLATALFSPHNYTEQRLNAATRKSKAKAKARQTLWDIPDSGQPLWLWAVVCVWLLLDIAWLWTTILKYSN